MAVALFCEVFLISDSIADNCRFMSGSTFKRFMYFLFLAVYAENSVSKQSQSYVVDKFSKINFAFSEKSVNSSVKRH